MQDRQQLLMQAEEARRFASLVSYAPDKARLMARAQELRVAAEALPERASAARRRTD